MAHESNLGRSRHCGEGMAVWWKVAKAQVPEVVLWGHHWCLGTPTPWQGKGKKTEQFLMHQCRKTSDHIWMGTGILIRSTCAAWHWKHFWEHTTVILSEWRLGDAKCIRRKTNLPRCSLMCSGPVLPGLSTDSTTSTHPNLHRLLPASTFHSCLVAWEWTTPFSQTKSKIISKGITVWWQCENINPKINICSPAILFTICSEILSLTNMSSNLLEPQQLWSWKDLRRFYRDDSPMLKQDNKNNTRIPFLQMG